MKKLWNNEITKEMLNEKVTVYGWVQKKRNLGGLIFIDLRDRSGLVQLVLNPDNQNYETAEQVKNEYVLKVEGTVTLREQPNKEIKSGEIEIEVENLEILNNASELPFQITDDTNALEDTRLKYRYLDIRRDEIKNKLITRSKIMMAIRKFLTNNDFIEVETPVLCKSTPEGARDYLVPSRVNPGKFYAKSEAKRS